MPSGMKEAVFNTRERLVSTDQNRAQKFKGADVAELMRAMVDTGQGTDDLDAAGVQTLNTVQGTPLVGEVFSGLMVKPQLGATTLDLLVDPGVAYVLDPDSAPDDSSYKYVRDPGVTTLATLTMTANGAGSARIDVIEVQDASSVVETDNRDIFNPSTGLFTATSVTKARASSFTYRVRLGVAGAGFPGVVQGWMPLCVASVPAGATGNDQMTFWDVRPMVGDRAFAPHNIKLDLPRPFPGTRAAVNTRVSAGKALMNGLAEYIVGNRRVGGRIRRGTPDTAANVDSVDLQDAANLSSGFSYVASGLYFVYLLLPFGLPRWARYTNAADGQRVPRSPRGIIAVSAVVPSHLYGSPGSVVALPTSTGLGGSTATGVCIEAAFSTAGSMPASADLDSVWTHDTDSGAIATTTFTAAGGGTSAQATWNLSENVSYPANARAIHVMLSVTFPLRHAQYMDLAGGHVDVQDTAGNKLSSHLTPTYSQGNPTGIDLAATTVSQRMRIPVPNQYPLTPGGAWTLFWETGYVNIGTDPAASASLKIVGWETGP